MRLPVLRLSGVPGDNLAPETGKSGVKRLRWAELEDGLSRR